MIVPNRLTKSKYATLFLILKCSPRFTDFPTLSSRVLRPLVTCDMHVIKKDSDMGQVFFLNLTCGLKLS